MPSLLQMIASVLFALALLHTFSTKYFEQLAHRSPSHSGLWHLLAEVEVVFGAWSVLLLLVIAALQVAPGPVAYLESLNFTEPAFVLVIMVIAASRPILCAATIILNGLARGLPVAAPVGFFFVLLSVGPLLGSLITEPAAMTLSALLLRRRFFHHQIPESMKYAALAVLFVNVSIGGVLTPFAAPPVLMVAAKWGWDLPFMLHHFGWKAVVAVLMNALMVTALFSRILKDLPQSQGEDKRDVPRLIILCHLLFLSAVVVFAHHMVVFIGIFLLFIGFAEAYRRYQDPLVIRSALLVAFFLAGLVVLGGQQSWWLQPLLSRLNTLALFVGATGLTAITDNAALTYLGSLVQELGDSNKYALVAGAVTGGGLTVIANAPNPAGYAILRPHFQDQSISAGRLFVNAVPPTLVAAAAFMLL